VRASEERTTKMTKAERIVAEEAIGNVIITAARGLDPSLARQIRDRVLAFGCEATLRNRRGAIASARSILQLLMLGAPLGERLVLHCHGPGAQAAYTMLAHMLQPRGGVS
jgi:phosphotransferase system HPr (HPr) family protein